MNVAQETLGFRRAGLSPALSLLMSAFALPIPPAAFTSHLRRPTERSPTIQESEVRGQKSETAHHNCAISNFDGCLAASWRFLGTHPATAAMSLDRCIQDHDCSVTIPASHLPNQSTSG